MIAGITNDSTITVAPIFWILMGGFYNKCWGGFPTPAFLCIIKKDLRSSPQRNGGNNNKNSRSLYHRISRFKRDTSQKIRTKRKRNLSSYDNKSKNPELPLL